MCADLFYYLRYLRYRPQHPHPQRAVEVTVEAAMPEHMEARMEQGQAPTRGKGRIPRRLPMHKSPLIRPPPPRP